MNRRFFGTDGVRGPYGGPAVNDALARRLAAAAARFFRLRAAASEGRRAGPALIGRDTRESGPALERAVAAGAADEGVEAVSLGVLPTPAVARAVRQRRAEFGVVVTASHNPATDNGIKFFGPDGGKLTDEEEAHVERLLDGVADRGAGGVPPPSVPDAAAEYVAAVSALLPPEALQGWKVVLDTANGATCVTSPAALRGLGAELIGLGDAPDGRNINAGVGSEHPEQLCAAVRACGARLGVAHDGDGDRCVLCDERGDVLDGDEILTLLAVHALRLGRLPKHTLVVTVQSNLGVDAAVEAAGGRVVRTPVGDRYVAECMAAERAALGGESSGHVICAEVSPAGDGLVAALKVIEVMRTTGRPLSELRRVLRRFPQLSAALPVREKRPLAELSVLQAAIREVEAGVGAPGRVLVRYSGTEPKIRLLVEGPNAERVHAGMARLESAVRAELGDG